MKRSLQAILPSHNCAQSLTNTFAEYFHDKIKLIRNDLETSLKLSTDPNSVSIFRDVSFEQFDIVSEADIWKIINQRNSVLLIRSLHGYSNNVKSNWYLYLQILLACKPRNELSSLHRWYSIEYTIPTGSISMKRGSNISPQGMYQGYKGMDDQQLF